jgi:hypothetical protein
VRARREQIRGYGYDEFSVFAELLQNAEDAYIERARLGMEMPEPCDIRYQYLQSADASWILSIGHRGRPFNYWQHCAVHRDQKHCPNSPCPGRGAARDHGGRLQ